MKILNKYSLFLFGLIFVIETVFVVFFMALARSINSSTFVEMPLLIAATALASVIASMIIVLSSPLTKHFLDTHRQLMRLENFSHPLLVKLTKHAAGTFHHSLVVANLTHKAAREIGADALLARVCGYYHDVGKLKNPMYFIENQNQTNPHNLLQNPLKSAQIVIGHVAEGIKLAEEYHFPKDIVDAIKQHHGTTIAYFFYESAKLQNKAHVLDKFQYSGPKPLTVENGILMLADAIEAKTRLEKQLTAYKIRQIVASIINEKLEGGQLTLSGLSDRDLDKIQNSFEENLKIVFHQRINYPKK